MLASKRRVLNTLFMESVGLMCVSHGKFETLLRLKQAFYKLVVVILLYKLRNIFLNILIFYMV